MNETTTVTLAPLAEFVPLRVRRLIWALYGLGAVIIGCLFVGFGAAEASLPLWLVVASPVYGSLAAPLSGLALANMPSVQVVSGEAVEFSDEVDEAVAAVAATPTEDPDAADREFNR